MRVCRVVLLLATLSALACNLTAALPTATPPPPTETPTQTPSVTPTPSDTAIPTETPLPTETPTITPTPTITLTPSITPIPSETPTPSNTPFPTVPPQPTVGLAGDKFTRLTLDADVTGAIGSTWLSIVNVADRAATVQPGTPVAASDLETVYLVSPDGNTRLKVLDLPFSTGQRLYWSPDGAYLAYFLEEGTNSGLYVLNLRLGVSLRMFAVDNLNPRGVISDPVWSPDSSQLTVILNAAYDVDIFSVGPEGTNFRSLAQSGGYDFWPVWSPDSRYVAFVSDRDVCPSWEPNAPKSCYTPDALPPDGGQLYVLDIIANDVRKVSDAWLREPPQWVTSTRLSFVGGQRDNVGAGSTLYVADVPGAGAITPRAITSANPNGVRIFRESWSRDGTRVVYQEAGAEIAIVMRDANGQEIGRTTELSFPRSAFTAVWSPDGQRVIIGGHNNQCPFGIFVLSNTFRTITRTPNPNPGVCDPVFSPDGRQVAFVGVIGSGAGSDGRFDAFIANLSGTFVRNVTGRLGGQVRVLGWVGGR